MGIFGLITAYGELVIPQIGWLYAFPVLALKNMPQYIIDTIPEVYPLRSVYIVVATFLDTLIDTAIELPLVGDFINTLLSVTFMQMILPVTIVGVVLLLLLAKVIKLLRDIL